MKPPQACRRCGYKSYHLTYLVGHSVVGEKSLHIGLCSDCLEEAEKVLKEWLGKETEQISDSLRKLQTSNEEVLPSNEKEEEIEYVCERCAYEFEPMENNGICLGCWGTTKHKNFKSKERLQ